MRKYMHLLALFLGCIMLLPSAHADDGSRTAPIEKVVHAFKSGDVERIASLVSYPLERPYPLPPIDGPKDFRARYKQVFDDALIERIAHSNPSKDWSDMGWRGIMFGDGVMWLDDAGRITAVNNSSTAGKRALAKAIRAQKRTLNPSLRHFTKPVLDWETKSYRIRIDEVADGVYRYAAWKRGQSTQAKPSLVLGKGALTWDGNGGNHHFTFLHGRYRYVCNVVEIGTAESTDTLDVYDGDRLLLEQPVLKHR